MLFSNVEGLVIPQGDVAEIAVDGVTVWQASKTVEYTPLEYIECNDDIAFNTGRYCDNDTKIELTFIRTVADARYLFGATSDGNAASFTGYMSGTNGGSWRFGRTYARPNIPTNTKLTVMMDETGVVVNGTKTSYVGTAGTFRTPQPLAVGGCTGTSGAIGATTLIGSLGRLRWWQADTLVMDWEPHMRSDGVIGYLDHVSGQFVEPA